MSKVYYFKDQDKIGLVLKELGIGDFSGMRVPVKVHMGEIGNRYYVKPNFIRLIVSELRKADAEPFILDSTVAYTAPRATVLGYRIVDSLHGFTKRNIKCPMVIDDKGFPISLNDFTFEVVENIYNSECMVVVSHVKGHILAGFGGAIKNLGMGGVTKNTKKFMHNGAKPVYDPSKCSLCGTCASICPLNAITIKGDRVEINYRKCGGCGNCAASCPTGALTCRIGNLQDLLALATKACISGKQVIYVNVLKNITRSCDCDPRAGPIICPDIGYLASRDIVAVDKASLDLIDEVKPRLFEKIHKIDPYRQVKRAQEIGLGSTEYELIKL